MGEILVERGQLAKPQAELLHALADAHVQQHGNDPEKSLAALDAEGALAGELLKFGDPQVDASLAAVGKAKSVVDAGTTVTFAPGSKSAAGLRFQVLRPHAKGDFGEVLILISERKQSRRSRLAKARRDFCSPSICVSTRATSPERLGPTNCRSF